ncbi:hypothetical protein FGO68_gene16388 [Halteria grandinella]|uniref:Calcium/calmodulin-dependent protein kinase II association-domain domain-containing protein n=1 Tax=Halteria grandinella TaxID=5974 RepID=A0A8J8NEK4_HALGN|nr:hypothetical protein FGO68_gene16388 [Halteria grandinella]
MESTKQTVLDLTNQLLQSIQNADWATYSKLCDPSLSCFEPEAQGHLVEGMEFHKFYFDLPRGGGKAPVNTTMASPHVRLIGDGNVAIVSYVRLVQRVTESGGPKTAAFEETRVWEKGSNGEWRHVHFHRSKASLE